MTNLPDYFWSKTKTTDCLIWMGAVNSKGYPCFLVDGSSELAHRVAYRRPNGYTECRVCRRDLKNELRRRASADA